MANGNLIEPLAGTPTPVEITPTDPAAAETPPTDQGADLPEKFLKLPAAGPLLAGSPPALSVKIKEMDETEEGKVISESAGPMQAAGLFFYRALDKATGVIGNSLYIAPETVKQADEAGQLASVAPAWNMVGQEASRNASINPVLTAGAPPAAAAMAPAPEPPQTASGRLPSPPASTQTRLAGARAKNLQEGSPTSGRAAQGRLLNNLLKPAI